MKKPAEGHRRYFVDETGDRVFYDSLGRLIVGEEGCSPVLGMGFIETDNPEAIRRALADLHRQVAADRYLQGIPSISRTNRAFHAKDDTEEVRYLVYRRLAELDFKGQFVIARKQERVFRTSYHLDEGASYCSEALV